MLARRSRWGTHAAHAPDFSRLCSSVWVATALWTSLRIEMLPCRAIEVCHCTRRLLLTAPTRVRDSSKFAHSVATCTKSILWPCNSIERLGWVHKFIGGTNSVQSPRKPEVGHITFGPIINFLLSHFRSPAQSQCCALRQVRVAKHTLLLPLVCQEKPTIHWRGAAIHQCIIPHWHCLLKQTWTDSRFNLQPGCTMQCNAMLAHQIHFPNTLDHKRQQSMQLILGKCRVVSLQTMRPLKQDEM